MPGGSDPDITTHDACSALPTTDRVSASIAGPSSRAPGSLIFVVVPSISVTAMFVRTGAVIGTQRNGDPAALQCGHHRIGARRGQQRDGVDACQGQGTRDVDALAAGFGGDRADPVYGAAGERRGER